MTKRMKHLKRTEKELIQLVQSLPSEAIMQQLYALLPDRADILIRIY